jgi:hypothetical protein
MNHFRVVLAVIAVALAVTPAFIASVAHAQEDPAAAEWCANHKGTVVDRYPASNAASDTPVAMGPAVRFCEFTGGEGVDPSDSRISIRLTTLASDQPAMAATAYLTKPEMAESGGSGNPASVYCADLGGVELGGQLAPDGGGSMQRTRRTSPNCASSPISRSSTPGDWRTTPWAPSVARTWSRSSAGNRRALTRFQMLET